ncbi:unnamed protein product [Victoria cruziana]
MKRGKMPKRKGKRRKKNSIQVCQWRDIGPDWRGCSGGCRRRRGSGEDGQLGVGNSEEKDWVCSVTALEGQGVCLSFLLFMCWLVLSSIGFSLVHKSKIF